jgi:hypothetical protein
LILRVHSRGWKRDQEVVRATVVTVVKGESEEGDDETWLRRRRHRVHGDYVCPFGIAGCQQDCPGCAPLSEAEEVEGVEDDENDDLLFGGIRVHDIMSSSADDDDDDDDDGDDEGFGF